jgi:D-lactate dehydrogenase
MSVNFRGGGTSLNGQAQTDGIMIDVRRWFSGVRVEDGGARARLRAGTLLGVANRLLERRGFKLGPDPASKDIATIGGVIANNSGGMRCGIGWDPYSTVESMTLVLASGTVIDTAAPDAEQRFAEAEPELASGLLELREELLADESLAQRVRRKYEIKNVTGYRLCALLDADTPLEIFRRLIVGSEGTLAFIAEAVMRTRPEPARTTLAWAHFASIDAAADVVPALVAAGARATELMVAPALIAAAWNMDGCPEYWRELPLQSAALIVELGGADEGELDAQEAAAARVLAGHETIQPVGFTRAHEEIELAWRVREGLFGLVGRLRPPGSALIIEDVCVRPERIAECARDLQALLGKHEFLIGVAGHASAGNLHFQLTPDFSKPEDLERYQRFMEELVELIVGKYDGSLKAEHGTGVNMAPYVEREWGEKATAMMWRVKRLADPHGVFNPDAVLNRDAHIHLKHLKSQPQIEELAAHCVECGFCEPVCPSRNLTSTPRQRIVIRREMARQPEGSPVYEALMADYEYDALQTCATDGTCRDVCPVAIDTGALMKELRRRERTEREDAIALAIAKRYATVERAARGGLAGVAAATAVLGERSVAQAPALLRRRVSSELLPALPSNLPPAAPARLPASERSGAAAVYLPACINRIFGNPARPRARAIPAGGARGRLGARRGAAVDSRRRRRALLRDAVELQGLPAGAGPHGRQDRRGAVALERGRRAPGRAGRELLRARPARGRRSAPARGRARALRADRGARLDRLGARPPAAASAHRSTREQRRGPSDLLGRSPRPRRKARGDRAAAGRRGADPGRHDLLRHGRRPRPAAPRAAGLGDARRGRRARAGARRGAPVQQPHLRDRPAAEHRRAVRFVRAAARAAHAAAHGLSARPPEAWPKLRIVCRSAKAIQGASKWQRRLGSSPALRAASGASGPKRL